MAQAAHGRHVVADEQHGAPAARHVLHGAEALALEGDVAHGEHFVDQENLRPQMGGHGEREPHLHARTVALDGRVHELFQAGEIHDAFIFFDDLPPAQAKDRAVEKHVFAAGQFGMEAGAHLQQRRDAAAQRGCAGRGIGDARQDFQQRALAGAVGADDAEHFAFVSRRNRRRRAHAGPAPARRAAPAAGRPVSPSNRDGFSRAGTSCPAGRLR
jgi:hypothetical protein